MYVLLTKNFFIKFFNIQQINVFYNKISITDKIYLFKFFSLYYLFLKIFVKILIYFLSMLHLLNL